MSERPTKLGEYEIAEEINRGAMGVIYRTVVNGTNYAVKTIKVKNIASTLRFRKEISALARLNHPSQVKILDAGEDAGFPFLVMELLQGKILSDLVGKPLPEELVLKIGISLASGLGEMHRKGLLHRDIKTSNIFVTDDEQVKILDLGLAAGSSDLEEEHASDVVGTIAYASPEQCKITKRPVDQRSDLYSVGITLFECMVGHLPFRADTPSELMKMHAAVVAPAIQTVVPTASAAISDIVAKLLAKDPDDRYQSASGLLYDLEQVANNKSKNFVPGTRDNLSSGNAQAIIGREAETAKLENAWKKCVSSFGAGLLVIGEAGSGKSHLIANVLSNSEQEGALVLKAKCSLHSSTQPLANIAEAFESLLSRLNSMQVDAKNDWLTKIKGADRYAQSLCQLSESFGKIYGLARSTESLHDDSDQQKFTEDILSFLSFLAEHAKALVLVFDDIQWIDPFSSTILEKLSSRIKEQKILLLMTARNDKENLPKVEQFLNKMENDSTETIKLSSLAKEASNKLVSNLLGNNNIEETFLEWLWKSTNGNPFVVNEYIRNLLYYEHLYFENRSWKVKQEGIDSIGISNDVFHLIQKRIDSLGANCKHVLSIAALVGNRFEMNSIIHASGLADDIVVNALQEATLNNLLETEAKGKFRFVHDRIRESVSSALSMSEKKEIYDKLADHYDSLPENQNVYEYAHCTANGNYDKDKTTLLRAFKANIEAGKAALASYAYQQAYDYFQFAHSCTMGNEFPIDLIKKQLSGLAIAASESGKENAAYEAIDQALSLTQDPQEVLECLYIKQRAYYNFGRFAHSFLIFKQVAELAGSPLPKYLFWRIVITNWLLFSTGIKLITGLGFGSVGPSSKKRRRTEILTLSYFQAMQILRFVAPGYQPIVVLRLISIAWKLGKHSYTVKALANSASSISLFRFIGVGRALMNIGHKLNEEIADPAAEAYLAFVDSLILLWTDDKTYYRHAESLNSDLYKYLSPFEISNFKLSWAILMNHHGDHQNSLESIQMNLPIVEKLGQKYFLAANCAQVPNQLAQLGNMREATESEKRLAKLVDSEVKDMLGGARLFISQRLHIAYETHDIGHEIEPQLQYLETLLSQDYFTRFDQGLMCLILLEKLAQAKDGDEARNIRLQLKSAIHKYYMIAHSYRQQITLLVARAGLARHEHKFDLALKYADQAYHLAKSDHNNLGIFYAARERARVFKELDDSYRLNTELALCTALAQEHGWVLRSRSLRKELGTSWLLTGTSEIGRESVSKTHVGTVAATRVGTVATNRVGTIATNRIGTVASTRVGTVATNRVGTIATNRIGTVTATRATGKRSGSGTSSGEHSNTIVAANSITREERAMSAITQIANASTKSLDPVEQGKAVLDQIVKMFGAERAFLFMTDRQSDIKHDEEKPPRLSA